MNKLRPQTMKLMRMLALVLAAVSASSAIADGRAVDETRDAQLDGFISINVMRGDVRLVGWDRPAISVEGTLDEKTEEFVFDTSGSETRIMVKVKDRNSGWYDNYGSDLTIRVPAASQVEFGGVSTDVSARDLAGVLEIGVVSGDLDVDGGVSRIDLQTVSGDVVLRNSSGRVSISTVSGDVETYDTVGDASYSTVSGNIRVEDGGTELRLESVSGDIEVRNDLMNVVGGHSVSGDIEIEGQPTAKPAIEFDAVSGSIRLRLKGTVNARFDIETGSGSIRNRLSDHKPRTARYTQEETLKFTLGSGDGQITLTTRSGDISISGS